MAYPKLYPSYAPKMKGAEKMSAEDAPKQTNPERRKHVINKKPLKKKLSINITQ